MFVLKVAAISPKKNSLNYFILKHLSCVLSLFLNLAPVGLTYLSVTFFLKLQLSLAFHPTNPTNFFKLIWRIVCLMPQNLLMHK
jgi:hypothetical protein